MSEGSSSSGVVPQKPKQLSHEDILYEDDIDTLEDEARKGSKPKMTYSFFCSFKSIDDAKEMLGSDLTGSRWLVKNQSSTTLGKKLC